MTERVACDVCGAVDGLNAVCLTHPRASDPALPLILCHGCVDTGPWRRRDQSSVLVDERGNRRFGHPDYAGKPVVCREVAA